MNKPIESKPKLTLTKTNRVVYNEQFVRHELHEMLEELKADESIKSKAHLFRSRVYSSARFSDWRIRFDSNKSVREFIKKIDEIIESRLVEQGLSGKSIPMTIFLLKNYYNYTDQYQQKVDTTISFKVSRGKTIDITPVRPSLSPSKVTHVEPPQAT